MHNIQENASNYDDLHLHGSTSPDGSTDTLSHCREDTTFFLVENALFRIPGRHFEQDSRIFRNMFSNAGDDDVGRTIENPMPLKGISKAEFTSFLKLVCPILGRRFDQRYHLLTEDWISILKLSTLWEFHESREQAIMQLAPTDADDPITTIELAMIGKIPQWFLFGLWQLAERQERLTIIEVERLGVKLSLRVAELQGKVQGLKFAQQRLGRSEGSMMAVFVNTIFGDMVEQYEWDAARSPSPPSSPESATSSVQVKLSEMSPESSPLSSPKSGLWEFPPLTRPSAHSNSEWEDPDTPEWDTSP